MTQDPHLHPALPWWRVHMVWLVIGGPAVVVVASVVTLIIALQAGDRPLRDTSVPQSNAQTPATQARNHAIAPRR